MAIMCQTNETSPYEPISRNLIRSIVGGEQYLVSIFVISVGMNLRQDQSLQSDHGDPEDRWVQANRWIHPFLKAQQGQEVPTGKRIVKPWT